MQSIPLLHTGCVPGVLRVGASCLSILSLRLGLQATVLPPDHQASDAHIQRPVLNIPCLPVVWTPCWTGLVIFPSIASSHLPPSYIHLLHTYLPHHLPHLGPTSVPKPHPPTFLTYLLHVLALVQTISTMAGGFVVVNEDQCRHYAGFAAHLDRHHFDAVYWVLFMLVVLMLFTASYKYSRSVPIFLFAPPPPLSHPPSATPLLTPTAQTQLP